MLINLHGYVGFLSSLPSRTTVLRVFVYSLPKFEAIFVISVDFLI